MVMRKSVAILQSNYLPWKGYFDIVAAVDEFIFYDDVQYTKNDWRNRNVIKSQDGPKWITIPCGSNIKRLVNEVTIEDHRWQTNHWKQIYHCYRKAKHFDQYSRFFEEVYLGRNWPNLSELNQYLIQHISVKFLGLKTQFRDSREFTLSGTKGDRVLDLLRATKASHYVSGSSAQEYINEETFSEHNIEVIWADYENYSEYEQLFPPFVHSVSIIDLLFNAGPAARDFLKFTLSSDS